MFFLQYIMINLVLTKSSGPKRHAVVFTTPIFAGFCVYHTDLSGAQQSECPLTAKMRPFIHWSSVSQTSKRFLPEVKNVAFCIWFLKSVKISFDLF